MSGKIKIPLLLSEFTKFQNIFKHKLNFEDTNLHLLSEYILSTRLLCLVICVSEKQWLVNKVFYCNCLALDI